MMAQIVVVGLVLALLSAAARAEEGSAAPPPAGSSVTVRWYGQAFFSLTRSDGFTVAIDPFKEMGYPMPKNLTADALLVTHEHSDHNNVAIIAGSPTVLRSEEAVGVHTAKDMTVTGTACYHDEEQGAKRGKNTAFSFELAGVRFCHMGDIGHLLSDEQLKAIGPVDVLMVPVGGYYTIAVEKIDTLIDQLDPKVVLPMHYKTEATPRIPIAPLDTWIKGKAGVAFDKVNCSGHPEPRRRVKLLRSPTVTIRAGDLPETREIWVLTYQ